MTLALLAALLVQPDPRIESIERLVGHAYRPYLWAPLAVTVKSAAGFDGDLVAQSSLGLRFVRRIRVPANGSERVILPAIDPQKVAAGGTTVEVPRDLRGPDFLVLVDARLPYASSLVSDDRILYQRIEGADLDRLLGMGLLDACDLLLIREAAALPLGSVRAWAAAPSRADAEKAVAERLKPGEAVLLVDLKLWALAPEGGWVPAKKDRAILFSVLYAFASFVSLALVARRRATWAATAVGVVAALGVLSFLLFFPRKHLWVSESSCEIVPVEGDAARVRLWFAGAAADLAPTIDFPRVVKPVYPKLGDAEEPLTIRIHERGSSAEGFKLAAGRRACFAATEGRAPTMRALGRAPRPLYRATLRSGGTDRSLGDLAAGSEIPALPPEERSPLEAEERPWLRFLEGDGLFGWLERGDRTAVDVGSPDLADGRCRPAFFMQRLK